MATSSPRIERPGSVAPCHPGRLSSYVPEKILPLSRSFPSPGIPVGQNCLANTFGRDCTQRCPPCVHSTATCHHITGQCDCDPGYMGPLCSEGCPAGHYGKHCTSICKCFNGSSCNSVDGSCTCLPGWTGSDCMLRCTSGTFGLRCLQICSCPNNVTCDPETGKCSCELSRSGDCITDVKGSSVIPVVPLERDSLGAIIGIVVLVILVVLLLALLIICRCRQRGKESRVPAVSYSSSHVINSEYAIPDVPHTYHHYYSNPSYHTLSQCGVMPPDPPKNRERGNSVKTANNPIFSNVKNLERERLGPYGPECNATLPADWKHHATALCKDIEYGNDPPLDLSSTSLNSENLYATIKDLPMLISKTSESSYMEMKSPVHRERSYAEIVVLAAPPSKVKDSDLERRSLVEVPESPTHNHYDLPKNSHIPCHYDLPPVRQPPCPKPQKLNR
ncbi:MEG10 protein, partial [Polypterus senegalus]